MRTPGSTPTAGPRQVALVAVALALCCAWGVPAAAGSGSAASAGHGPTPTDASAPDTAGETGPDVSTATPDPDPDYVGTATNATRNGTTPPERAPGGAVEPTPREPTLGDPGGTRTPVPDDGSRPVRTAVDGSTERLDDGLQQEPPTGEAARLGPPATLTPSGPARSDLRTPAPNAGTTTPPPGTGAGGTGDEAPQRTTARVPSTSTPGAPQCSDCGVPVSVGVVLLGLAGGAGAAVGLGLTPPHPTLGWRALRQWLDHHPRLPPVLPARFGRSTDADPLANPHRERLRELVDDRPGIHLGGLVDEVTLSRSSVRHHVRVLEDADELETTKLLGRRRLFPPDVDTELLAAVADEGSRRVVRAVAAVGPASVGEVADEADRAYSTVSYHLDRLETAGVVTRESDGRSVSVRLTDEAAALLGVTGDGADTAAD